MRKEFQRLHHAIKGTFIYVTHDQVEAMSLGNKIAVMQNGSVAQFGSPAEVFNHPVNTFVGGFIGYPPMNMLEGTLAQEGKNWVIDFGGFTYPLTKRLGEYLNERASYKIVMGIRSEDVILFRERNPDTVEVKVDTFEHLGSDLYAELSTKNITVISRLKPYEKITVGEKVWIQFREGGIHFFDKKSGTRLLNVKEFD
jgi:multiple sugar transport system ATP-binding protein